LRLYPRRPYACNQPSTFDYPLSTRFDETDSLVVFHDVFVPWEHVFVYRDVNLARAQWFETPAHILGNNQAQIRLVSKVKFLAGLAQKIASTNGIDKLPPVQTQLGEVASLAAVVEGMELASEATAVTDVRGIVHPNPRFLYGAMGLQAELYPRLVHLVRELAGGGVIQLPASVRELTNAATADDMRRYVQSPGVPAEQRVKLFKLVWDMVGSEFGGRHYQYEMFYAGAPFVAKTYAYRNYGFPDVAQMVDACLAGYDLEHPGA
jgi:4-hydroxyphenylacetate 3-monooxygenase